MKKKLKFIHSLTKLFDDSQQSNDENNENNENNENLIVSMLG